MHIDEFSNFMNKLGCEFCLNEPLSRHSSFKIGGLADVFIKPYDIIQLKSVLRFCREKDVPYVVIGNGSNILFKDEGFRIEKDLTNETLNYKIREYSMQKVPFLIIVGNKEKEENRITIRTLGEEKQISMSLDEFIFKLKRKVESKADGFDL